MGPAYFACSTMSKRLRRGYGAGRVHRSPFPQPEPVLFVGGIHDDKAPALFLSGHPPFVRFGMSIGKSEAAAQIVARAGNVEPLRAFHPGTKGRIIDMAHVLVQQNP